MINQGTVTQTRTTGTPFKWDVTRFQSGVGVLPPKFDEMGPLNNALQVTTSFRTGSGYVYDKPTTYSEFFRDFVENSSFDTGHNFSTVKRTEGLSHPRHTLHGRRGITYHGPLRIDQSYDPNVARRWNPWIPDTPFDHVYWGTKAISATMPTQPVASLSQTITELYREGLPSLVGSAFFKDRIIDFRKLGSEYLNVEFGWKPLISDFVKLLHAVVDAEKHWGQYARDNGRLVRRNYTFPRESPVTTFDTGTQYMYNVPNTSQWSDFFSPTSPGPFPSSKETSSQSTIRFSGAYTYYLPGDESFGEKLAGWAAQANHLLGIRLTPDVLWNLAPWSWLADWVWNIGDNLSVATAIAHDGLLLKYGYIMRETNSRVVHTTFNVKDYFENSAGNVIEAYVSSQKLRVRADPYGFALQPGAFSDRQWAILAALGMSRGGAHSLQRFGD